MTRKQFISFIGGFILTAIIYGAIISIIMVATFSLGEQTLTKQENKEAFFFYTAFFISAATVYIIFRQLKINRKFSAIGICIPLLFACFMCFKSGLVYFDNLNYQQQFDKKIWTETSSKPFKMAKTLANENVLIGQTKQQIIEQLGTTHYFVNNGKVEYLKYDTDKESWDLYLYFKNNKVTEAYLYEDGL